MDDMRAQRFPPGGDRPHVQIVNLGNAFRFQNRLFDGSEIDMCRRAFEQHICGFAN